jgi:hypothetical protein
VRGVQAAGELGLALLVLAWVQARLEQPEERERPRNRREYAMTALLGKRRMGGGWRDKLDRGEITLEGIRDEIRASPRKAPARSFDPAVCVARLRTYGWGLRVVGDRLEKYEIDLSTCQWSAVPEDFRRECKDHTAELKAYVLAGAAAEGSRHARE